MSINFQEILKELEYRVEHGIIDLTKEEQVTKLVEILRENGVSDANEMAQKARVYFSYLNEAPKKQSLDKVLTQKFTNPETGNQVTVASALGYKKNSKAYTTAKSMMGTAGYSEKDVDMVDAGPDDDEKPQGTKLGGNDFKLDIEKDKKQEPTKKVSGAEDEEGNESPKYDRNNQYQRAIAEAKDSKELQKALTNLHAAEEQKMFKDKIAGAGGMVASTGESMYVGLATDLINGTSDTKNTPLYQKALQVNQKNTQKILDLQKGREFKQLAVELEAISISQKLDLKNPDDFKAAVQIYNERESFVTAYDAQFKKTNVGKDSKFKNEEARKSWISSSYMGYLSLQKNGPANWDRKKGNGTVMKANGITDGATE